MNIDTSRTADCDAPEASLYRGLVEGLGQGLAVLGTDGAMRYANQALADLLGTERDLLVGAALTDLLRDLPGDLLVRAAHAPVELLCRRVRIGDTEPRLHCTLGALPLVPEPGFSLVAIDLGPTVEREALYKVRRELDTLARTRRELESSTQALHRAQIDAQRLMTEAAAAQAQVAGANARMASEIAARQRTESALRESEARMRLALEISHTFDFEWDPATDQVRRGESFAGILGVSREEARHDTGQAYFARIHPEDRARFTGTLAALTPWQDTYRIEYRLKRGDGREAILAEAGRGFFDTQGQLRRLVGATTDITQRKRMECRLRESETRFRTLFDSSGAALVLYDARGAIDCNESALRLFGCPREALLGQGPETFSPARQPDGQESRLLLDQCRTAALRQGHHRFEWRHRRLDGSEFTVETQLTGVELQGEPVLLAALNDITERQAMLAALAEAKQAAERAAQGKSLFLANMSHEIRTPMNAILGMLELCLATDLTDPQRNYLSKIRSAADALLRIIDDILDFSRIEAGRLEMVAEPFTLARVFEHLESLLGHRVRQKGLALIQRIDPALDQHVLLGDPQRLGQVLINLVANAIKFSRAGAIQVCAAGEPSEPGRIALHVAVRDPGIGIAPADQWRLFRPFTQADATTARDYGGTGLGLAISRHLVKLMGGTIALDSAPDQGSTFQFTVDLPLAAQAPATLPAHGAGRLDRAALATIQGAEILLVDDAELNQEVMRELLELAGLRVRIAANGAEALRAVAESRPDAVLMDCQMPVMDGFEASRRLRAQPDYRELPIIALTANAMAGDQAQCLAAGMNAFVAKPVEFGALAAALLRWIPPRPAAGPERRCGAGPDGRGACAGDGGAAWPGP